MGKIGNLITPRGVFKCKAMVKDNAKKEPRFGAWGKQQCQDTGPLTAKRMETVDEEFLAATKDFIKRSDKANKPFFVWFNATRMHVFTNLQEQSSGKSDHGAYSDGMVENNGHVGKLAAVRYEDYKVHFMIQEAHGWKHPYTPQAWPSLVDLRADPFERGMHELIGYSFGGDAPRVQH